MINQQFIFDGTVDFLLGLVSRTCPSCRRTPEMAPSNPSPV